MNAFSRMLLLSSASGLNGTLNLQTSNRTRGRMFTFIPLDVIPSGVGYDDINTSGAPEDVWATSSLISGLDEAVGLRVIFNPPTASMFFKVHPNPIDADDYQLGPGGNGWQGFSSGSFIYAGGSGTSWLSFASSSAGTDVTVRNGDDANSLVAVFSVVVGGIG
jgi:hypothetical protein